VDSTNYGKKIAIDLVTGEKIEFIPAKVTDNLVLMREDPNYEKRLSNLPEELKKAFRDGNWEIFENQAFGEFRQDIHVIPHFEPPAHWRRWRSCDPGYNDPFVFLWYAVDEEGTVHVYREYTRDYGDDKIAHSDQARKVMELSICKVISVEGKVSYEPEKIDFTATGLDAWACRHETKDYTGARGKSIIDHYNAGGLCDNTRAITDRKLRCATIHEYLRVYIDDNTGKERSKILIHDCCKTLIETLPLQVTDPADIEKYKDTDYDHACDSLGYGLLAYHADKSKPAPQNLTRIEQHKKDLLKRLNQKRRRLG
jgi:phage terminase large subunit